MKRRDFLSLLATVPVVGIGAIAEAAIPQELETVVPVMADLLEKSPLEKCACGSDIFIEYDEYSNLPESDWPGFRIEQMKKCAWCGNPWKAHRIAKGHSKPTRWSIERNKHGRISGAVPYYD